MAYDTPGRFEITRDELARAKVLASIDDWSYVRLEDGRKVFVCATPNHDPADCPIVELLELVGEL